jgi:hypothetical protein
MQILTQTETVKKGTGNEKEINKIKKRLSESLSKRKKGLDN